MNPQLTEDITTAFWLVIAVIFFFLLYKAALSAEKAKKQQKDSEQHPNILDQIESESIYCGAPATNAITTLYKAAKRARKDKALSRDIRTELDKAINQYENSLPCQN
ncbi:MAG: hypothetical protein JZU65_19495 [Chlorobium sp.]|jgi:hypothetical protein|nr:hypothetical protein [Chlorobium sp.]